MDNNIIDKRTKGEWDFGYGDNSKSFGIFTKKMLDEGLLESPICLISPIDKMNDEDKANAAFIVKACNEYESLVKANRELLEALKEITKEYEYALNIIAESGGFPFNADQNNLLISTKEAIKKHSPIN